MTREIKFRVWDHNTDTMMIPDNFEFYDGEIGWIDAGREAGPESGNDGDPGQFEIMEYTGLHDKNGREIYEDDIVELERLQPIYGDSSTNLGVITTLHVVVSWDESSALWVGGSRLLWKTVVFRGGVVIGNIYENPELLEDNDGKTN